MQKGSIPLDPAWQQGAQLILPAEQQGAQLVVPAMPLPLACLLATMLCIPSPAAHPKKQKKSHDCAATPHNPTGGARCSALYEPLARRGCVYQARHGFERPGWFLGDGVGPAALPKPYDYYGAYSAEDSGWRLGAGAADVPSHSEHLYHRTVDGELTFDWPSSFDAVASECAAAREGVALFDTSYFGKLRLDGSRADAAMQWLCAADLEGRPTGSVTYTPLCNANGGVEADLTVTKLDDNAWYIVTGGATGAISQLGARVRGRGWGGGKSGRAGQAGRGGERRDGRRREWREGEEWPRREAAWEITITPVWQPRRPRQLVLRRSHRVAHRPRLA